MYLQPKPKKPLGHSNPNGLIYLIHNETFIEKILKFTLATLGVLALIVAILGIMLYRNLGELPDENRFAHLPYYKNGQFVNLYTDIIHNSNHHHQCGYPS